MDPSPNILFIDAYDSYSNNIAVLLQQELGAHVQLIHIDDNRFVQDDLAFRHLLKSFDAVLVGPGPGNPGNVADVGLIDKLWTLPSESKLPVLGICLGFQSLCLNLEATAEPLLLPRHGLVTAITHNKTDIFSGSGCVLATQYHSLHVITGHQKVHAAADYWWIPSEKCPQLMPLAWDFSDDTNGPVLMAARHADWPFWGVQYHPESICTNAEGQKLIKEWWKRACAWNKTHRISMLRDEKEMARSLPDPTIPQGVCNDKTDCQRSVRWRVVPLHNHFALVDFVGKLRKTCNGYQPILLQSGLRGGKPVNLETGRFSVIAVHDASSIHVRYSTADRHLTIVAAGKVLEERMCGIKSAYACIDELVRGMRALNGPENIPFWGGMVGYISYEAALEGINVASKNQDPNRPDIWFIQCERSVVIDHVAKLAYIQTVRREDSAWMEAIHNMISGSPASEAITHHAFCDRPFGSRIVSELSRDQYCRKIDDSLGHLHAGSSYELCLTAQTIINCDASPWDLYCRLQSLNPAPFGAYLEFKATERSPRIKGVEIISSSPERFMSWTRAGRCQFRPIKGTVKKEIGIDRAAAESILRTRKEKSENLMIVDLIRHDMNGIARSTNQTGAVVPKLMAVEEYETVFQLVSVIEGDMKEAYHGMAGLSTCLPPGSMTGAPKKRSCELLAQLEDSASGRGLYSGVLGYYDVGGAGDFSVIIRTAFKWDDGDWSVGAGGALTVLSEHHAEYEEMDGKRESLLQAFCLVSPR